MTRPFLPVFLLIFTLLVPIEKAAAEVADPRLLRRIAFGSCANQNLDQPIWKPLVAAKPDLLLFVGDNIYADTEDMTSPPAD